MVCEDVKSMSDAEYLPECYSKECECESDSCFTHISHGIVRRGCLKDSIQSFYFEKKIDLITDCKDKSMCELCSGKNNCNNKDVPAETCIECDSESDINCVHTPNPTMIKECMVSIQPRGCFVQKAVVSNIKRGCISDLNEIEAKKCTREGSTCKSCIGNNCNMDIKFQSCHFCDSSKDNGKCVNNAQETKICKDFAAKCFIRVENNTVSRGCLGEDMSEEECFIDNCKICQHLADCNNENIKTEVCISCDSKTDATCKTNATATVNEICPLSINHQGCYHFIDEAEGHQRKGIFQITNCKRFAFLFPEFSLMLTVSVSFITRLCCNITGKRKRSMLRKLQ